MHHSEGFLFQYNTPGFENNLKYKIIWGAVSAQLYVLAYKKLEGQLNSLLFSKNTFFSFFNNLIWRGPLTLSPLSHMYLANSCYGESSLHTEVPWIPSIQLALEASCPCAGILPHSNVINWCAWFRISDRFSHIFSFSEIIHKAIEYLSTSEISSAF